MTHSKKIKVVFLVNVDWFFVSHRLNVAEALIANDYEVHLVTTVTDRTDTLARRGITVHHIDFGGDSVSKVRLFKTILIIYTIIKNIKPDIVHLVTPKALILGGVACRLAFVKHIIYAFSGLGHFFRFKPKGGSRLSYLGKISYCLAIRSKGSSGIFQNAHDATIINSSWLTRVGKSYQIAGSGVDLRLFGFSLIPRDKNCILFASRLLIEKGIMDFAEAAKILLSDESLKHLNLRFLVAGYTDFSNSRYISKNDLFFFQSQGIIDYLGHVSNMAKLIRKSSVVVLPSYYGEGMPKVLLEAAAVGRPVVTSAQAGCASAVENGVTGVLVNAKDPEALATSLKALIMDKKRLREMGRAGRRHAVEKFSVESVVEKHLQIYKKALNR